MLYQTPKLRGTHTEIPKFILFVGWLAMAIYLLVNFFLNGLFLSCLLLLIVVWTQQNDSTFYWRVSNSRYLRFKYYLGAMIWVYLVVSLLINEHFLSSLFVFLIPGMINMATD